MPVSSPWARARWSRCQTCSGSGRRRVAIRCWVGPGLARAGTAVGRRAAVRTVLLRLQRLPLTRFGRTSHRSSRGEI